MPVPQPRDNELLVRIHAASVNPVDYKIRCGAVPWVNKEMLPITLGRDLSGTVESGSVPLKRGEAVYALLGGIDRGSYAEYEGHDGCRGSLLAIRRCSMPAILKKTACPALAGTQFDNHGTCLTLRIPPDVGIRARDAAEVRHTQRRTSFVLVRRTQVQPVSLQMRSSPAPGAP